MSHEDRISKELDKVVAQLAANLDLDPETRSGAVAQIIAVGQVHATALIADEVAGLTAELKKWRQKQEADELL